MDIYSAAKRLTRPFLFDETRAHGQLTLAAHGLIGDGFSAALVRADGVIDWLCLPRFDSPSVFGAILDEERGGLTAVTPSAERYESLQRYDPDTNVLETLFSIPGQGTMRITDFMPWTDDPRLSVHEVHRRIECVEGAVELDVIFDPRFEYGEKISSLEHKGNGVSARAPSGEPLVAMLSGEVNWRERKAGGVETHIGMRAGERRWMVISWNSDIPSSIKAYRSFELLRATRHRWREWTRQLQYDGPWRHHVVRSALLLKLLIYAPTGAMVAAPTTSLPEWIGGKRNWDYRYTWTRDTAMAIRSANLIGCLDEARDFFHFVRDTLEHDRTLRVMYAVDGGHVQEERVLEHLRGYQGSVPVRVGNDARDQLQFDTAGALMDAAYAYERGGGSLTLRAWRSLREVVSEVEKTWREPDHGIWEPRNGVRHNTHSKLMSWVALHSAAELAPLFGDTALQERWKRAADEVHAEVCERALDKSGQHFVAAYDHDHVDASLLLLPIHGFLPADHPQIIATMQRIRDELSSSPFLKRYHVEDGVGGEEGAFVLCGFWLAEALAMAGRIDEAQEIFIAHAEASNHVGLLAEEIDARSGELLGNFPQAFSHLGLINAAAQIDRALQRHDEGLDIPG